MKKIECLGGAAVSKIAERFGLRALYELSIMP